MVQVLWVSKRCVRPLVPSAVMTSNEETLPALDFHTRMQRIREGIHIKTMKAKRKVEDISKEDVQAFFKKNAFVLFTVAAVVVGE